MLRWIGHVIQMQSNRLPRRVLYSKLQHGQRATGGQKKRFWDQVRAILRKCSVPSDKLDALAADRVAWRDVCEERLADFDINYDQETESRHACRHTVTRLFLHPALAVASVAAQSSSLSSPITDQLAQRPRRSRRTSASKQTSIVLSCLFI